MRNALLDRLPLRDARVGVARQHPDRRHLRPARLLDHDRRGRASRWPCSRSPPLMFLLHSFARDREERWANAVELHRAYRGTVMLLSDVVESEDSYTAEHSRSVVELVNAVADELGVAEEDRRELEFAAMLHDVGKIAIPNEILNKPSTLEPARVRGHEDPHDRGPVPARPRGRPARPRRPDRALVPRALGRRRLPRRARRREHPVRLADRLLLRRLQRHDERPRLPQGAADGGTRCASSRTTPAASSTRPSWPP